MEDENLKLNLIVEDQTREQFPLVRDALEGSYKVMSCIYGNGNYVYYIKMTVDKLETIFYSMYENLLIQEVDLTDFSERTVLQIRMNEKKLMGTVFRANQVDWIYYLGISGFSWIRTTPTSFRPAISAGSAILQGNGRC